MNPWGGGFERARIVAYGVRKRRTIDFAVCSVKYEIGVVEQFSCLIFLHKCCDEYYFRLKSCFKLYFQPAVLGRLIAKLQIV